MQQRAKIIFRYRYTITRVWRMIPTEGVKYW